MWVGVGARPLAADELGTGELAVVGARDSAEAEASLETLPLGPECFGSGEDCGSTFSHQEPC